MEFDFGLVSSSIVFVVVYGAIIFRNVRNVNLPVWLSMTFGAFAILVLQIVKVDEAISVINFDVIFFLLGMFVLVAGLEYSGMLGYVTNKILSFAKNPQQILFFILFPMGIFSAFLINDTVALVATPIVLGLAKQMKIRPAPLLISLAFGITIGSMMTPMGNPQNLLVSLHSGIDFPLFTFLRYLFIPTILCLISSYFILKWYYKKEFSNMVMPNIVANKTTISNIGLAKASAAIVVAVVIGFFILGIVKLFGISLELNFAHIALFGGAALLLISKEKKEIVRRINWQILVFFAAMFVFMQGLWNGGLIELLQTALPFTVDSNVPASTINIIGTSVLTSQLVSNVPFVAIYLPILQNHGFAPTDTVVWIALASGSTIAGNLTILAAASNVIILEEIEKRKETAFTFIEFFKIGAIITASNLALLILFLTFPL
jgi:Na+/H+ antiporter NhaD/arsenite permease-like protein